MITHLSLKVEIISLRILHPWRRRLRRRKYSRLQKWTLHQTWPTIRWAWRVRAWVWAWENRPTKLLWPRGIGYSKRSHRRNKAQRLKHSRRQYWSKLKCLIQIHLTNFKRTNREFNLLATSWLISNKLMRRSWGSLGSGESSSSRSPLWIESARHRIIQTWVIQILIPA